MHLAIIFWFYKEPEVCRNRLEMLKKYNPLLKIYGLYGGDKRDVHIFKSALGIFLDDFYTSPFDDPNWKWINGDLAILDWYNLRGKYFSWDSIVVVQWDLLAFGSFLHSFPNIEQNEIFLSGLRNLDEQLRKSWYWSQPERERNNNYENFINYVQKEYKYNKKDPPCCQFILAIIPRVFFDRYLNVKEKEIGMLEYKIPIYAEIFDIAFYKKDIGVSWDKKKDCPLNAHGIEIEDSLIHQELNNTNGWRFFHPYFKQWR